LKREESRRNPFSNGKRGGKKGKSLNHIDQQKRQEGRFLPPGEREKKKKTERSPKRGGGEYRLGEAAICRERRRGSFFKGPRKEKKKKKNHSCGQRSKGRRERKLPQPCPANGKESGRDRLIPKEKDPDTSPNVTRKKGEVV